MLKLATGHWVSQACAVFARLGIADRLADGPRRSDELALEVEADPDALYRLLRGCACAGLVAEGPDRTFTLTTVGGTLRSDVAGSLRDFLIAQTLPGHWLPWGRLYEAVREGRAQTVPALGCDIFTFYARHPDESEPFNRAMGSLSSIVANEVLASFDFSGYAKVSDVGGGHGVLLAAILEKFPELSGVLFDLPHAIDEARSVLAGRGLSARAELVAGDFFESVPPADVYLLKAILHDWDDARARHILRNCRANATYGAKVLIIEVVIAQGESSLAELMDLNMLVMLTGRERRADEYGALLEASGFRLDRVVPTRTPFSILEATAAV
jgi:hypothetical protein